MLTRNHRQEALSRAYVQAIVAQAGLSYSVPSIDYGIDLSIRAIEVRGNRRTDASIQLDVQLKSTTRAVVGGDHLSYDLSVRDYDNLRDTRPRCPRIVVVLVLPADEALWVSQSPAELTIRHCAYWRSLQGLPAVPASRTTRIEIPVANVFSVEALQGSIQRLREGKDP